MLQIDSGVNSQPRLHSANGGIKTAKAKGGGWADGQKIGMGGSQEDVRQGAESLVLRPVPWLWR